MMFAVIAPLLMTGAFAERLKFKAFLFITLMWELFIYYPVAHWIWGGGWLAQQGVLDFAGGITIHTTAGISGVVICVLLGKRKGFSRNHGEFPPSNMLAACLGAMLLWIGWFGFNAGSALSAGRSAVAAIVSTHIAASASAAVWLFAHWGRYGGRTSLVALLNGAVAGLAGVTPASGYISSLSALVLGVILGFASLVTVSVFKSRLHIDDALDVIGVHGVTGIVGSIFMYVCHFSVILLIL
jgi:Amt family ammonium transporter